MSEELVQPEETVVEKPAIKAKTAFMVIQAENGGYYAINNLDTALDIQHLATLLDIKAGCREIGDAFLRNDIVAALKPLLAPKPEETVSSSIRESLEERGIL